jgi:Lipocalin-like domain
VPGDPLARGEFVAYFGTYDIDARSRTVVHHIVGSLAGKPASPELRRQYEFADGNLVLTFPWTFEGMPVENRLVWKRVATP